MDLVPAIWALSIYTLQAESGQMAQGRIALIYSSYRLP